MTSLSQKAKWGLLTVTGCLIFFLFSAKTLNVESLSQEDRALVDSFLEKTTSFVDEKKAHGNVNLLTWDELNALLGHNEKNLVRKILKLKPADLRVRTPSQKEEKNAKPFVIVTGQKILLGGKPSVLKAQAVSPEAYQAYETMMRAMEKDLGKRLYIESAHRSKAYQTYNFIKYLREHDYSLVETAKLNALPGYSEHNLLTYHAIDLINAEGINGEPHVEDYENLPEYQWMLKHAANYGFTLSYPRGNPWGIGFEPWHWRFQPKLATRLTEN